MTGPQSTWLASAMRSPGRIGRGHLRDRGVSTEAREERELREVLEDHLSILRKERLVTDRPSVLMRAADGRFVEVFEWKSGAAIEAAHENPEVRAMWARFDGACTYESLGDRKESKDLFANFESVEL